MNTLFNFNIFRNFAKKGESRAIQRRDSEIQVYVARSILGEVRLRAGRKYIDRTEYTSTVVHECEGIRDVYASLCFIYHAPLSPPIVLCDIDLSCLLLNRESRVHENTVMESRDM